VAAAVVEASKSSSLLMTVTCIVIAFVAGVMIVLQTALSVVLADLSNSSAFSNFFKFIAATFLIFGMALFDYKDTMIAARKSWHFFKNDVSAPELYHPLMEASPLIRNHPWLFVYLAGVFRAAGFVFVVYSSQICGT
jgi:hypothetical protein